MKPFNIADLFCGAGGSSTGTVEAVRLLGFEPRLTAINHNAVAIATHAANHPTARHYCARTDSLNPCELFPRVGELSLLWGSPSCRKHSKANRNRAAKDPASEQDRATAHCVTRWSDALRPDTVLGENVPEFRQWESFGAWLAMLESQGYTVDHRVLNCADYGDPQTRRRLFVQAQLGRRKIYWPDPTHTKTPDLFGNRKPWVCSRDVLDLALPAQRVADRKRPLAPNTMARIREGLEKFGGAEFLVCMEHGGRVLSASEPFPTITTAKGGAIALCQPFLIEYYGTGGARSTEEPFATVTTRDRFALVIPKPDGVYFRMVAAKEYAAAQGFRPDYQFKGNGTEVTKQIGNAVPRNTARALVLAAVGQRSDIAALLQGVAA